jgi:hypothetical protein
MDYFQIEPRRNVIGTAMAWLTAVVLVTRVLTLQTAGGGRWR